LNGFVRGGNDPAEEKRARRDASRPEADTFGAVVRDYLERHVRANCRASTYAEGKGDLEYNALPKWRNRPVASISRRDVIDLVDGIVERGAPAQANRSLARLRAVFNWAVEKDRVATSPVAKMKMPSRETPRDRVLTDDEMRWFWRACERVGWPFGPLCRLLLLTAQRRTEVASMAWSEVDLNKHLWIIPRQKTKSDREHVVALSDAAIGVLRKLPNHGRLVFSTTGQTPVSGFSWAKRSLDEAMRRDSGADIPAWTLHDLRRTGATGMARLGVAPHVVEKILNHTGGAIGGVASIYNRFAYLDERRAALEALIK
jgi:integrase